MYMSVVVCFILFFSALYCRLPAVDFASEVERAFLAFGMFQNYTCPPGKHAKTRHKNSMFQLCNDLVCLVVVQEKW